MKKQYLIFMAMLVLAIFAVGSVSAEDNVTTDIDVPVDDIVVDEVSTDDAVEQEDASSDANKIVNTRYNANVAAGSSSSVIDAAITTVNSNGGGNVYFTQGDYYNISITMKSNVNLIGNGARLIGTGSSHVINLPNNLNNFTISGFIIDVNNNNASDKISAIYGSFITNGNINGNTMYNGTNGININKKYDNMTVEDNIIYDMKNDGISFAHPNTNSNINTLGNTYITGNTIYNCKYGIFIGGNFKGVISDNNISNCTWGIQFAGKKDGQISNIIANITGNNITNVTTGIEFINMTVISLNIDSNIITTISNETFAITSSNYFAKATGGELNITDNDVYGIIKQSIIDMCDNYW